MAGDPNPIEDDFDTPAPPDMDAVRAALGRKAATECPVCGVRDWLIPDGTNLIYPNFGPSGDLARTALVVVAAVCNGCGYVRLHDTDRLLMD